MKTINLSRRRRTVSELLALAKSGALRIHSQSGEDFILEPAGEIEKEVEALGRSAKFAAFLRGRSEETGDIPLSEVRRKRSIR